MPSPFSNQTQRIAQKLAQARLCDPGFAVFGAKSHKYQVGPPLDHAAIATFSQKHGITLPADLIAFLTEVGHGAPNGQGAAAGPFYGITRLGDHNLAIGGAGALHLPPLIHPNLTDTDWQAQMQVLNPDDDSQSDDDYDRALSRVYAGLLTLGHQGCQSYHAVLIAGPNQGRVVNIDLDGHKPRFAFDQNFLGWYERWLDEIISGPLRAPDAGWFGYDRIKAVPPTHPPADNLTTRLAKLLKKPTT